MLANFYIPRVSNDMQIAVQKKHLRGQILYRSLDPIKKRRRLNPVPTTIRVSSLDNRLRHGAVRFAE